MTQKTDNQLLEESLFHIKETRRAVNTIKTCVVIITVLTIFGVLAGLHFATE